MNKLSESEEFNLKAIQIRELIYPKKNHPVLATSYISLANTYLQMKRLIEFEELYLKAIQILESVYPNKATYINLLKAFVGMNKMFSKFTEI